MALLELCEIVLLEWDAYNLFGTYDLQISTF